MIIYPLNTPVHCDVAYCNLMMIMLIYQYDVVREDLHIFLKKRVKHDGITYFTFIRTQK